MATAFDPAVAVSLGVSAAVALLGPVALALVAWRRLGASWLAWLAGAGTFFVFQLVLRVPWVAALGAALGPTLKASPALSAAYIVFLSFTAGLFEETGRWVVYRFVWKDRAPKNALMLGLGHGGLESMLLVGLSIAGSLYLYVALGHGVKVPLPEAALAAIAKQFEGLTPLNALAGGVERLSAMALHVGCSLLVLQVFTRGQLRWLWLAMAVHTSMNAVGVLLAKHAGVWISEGAMALFAAAALAWAVRLARAPPPEAR